MRLTEQQARELKRLANETFGPQSILRLFGSRAIDTARGGDVDLMVETAVPVDRPAMLAARFSALAARVLHGRGVDVLIAAPNLVEQPIHRIARTRGVQL